MAVPSGLAVSLSDVIVEAQPQIARFRFVMPSIGAGAVGGQKQFSEVVGDMQFLCDVVVVPALQQNGWHDGEIVVSVSDRAVDFGFYDPQVTQFFLPFQLKDAACQWEDF